MMTSAPIDYADFAVPTLFIVGDQDALTVPWLMEATAAAVPNAVVRSSARRVRWSEAISLVYAGRPAM